MITPGVRAMVQLQPGGTHRRVTQIDSSEVEVGQSIWPDSLGVRVRASSECPSESSDSLSKQHSFPGGGESVVPETRPSHPALAVTVTGPMGAFVFSVVQVRPDIIGTL